MGRRPDQHLDFERWRRPVGAATTMKRSSPAQRRTVTWRTGVGHGRGISNTTRGASSPPRIPSSRSAVRVAERNHVERYVDAERVKYAAEWNDELYTVDFFINGTYMATPTSAFGLVEKDFATSPTRWTF